LLRIDSGNSFQLALWLSHCLLAHGETYSSPNQNWLAASVNPTVSATPHLGHIPKNAYIFTQNGKIVAAVGGYIGDSQAAVIGSHRSIAFPAEL
jgi:hypothetical protein